MAATPAHGGGSPRTVRVAVRMADPIGRAGVTRYLESWPGIVVLPPGSDERADVAVLLPNRLTPDAFAYLRKQARTHPEPAVLLADHLGETDVLAIVACHVKAVLPRSAVADDRLARAVRELAARPVAPRTDLVDTLATHMRRLRGDGLVGGQRPSLKTREINVLRLMADGFDTAAIARELCYSERTVKNIIHACTSRLNLRNRPHAVAYALRSGVI